MWWQASDTRAQLPIYREVRDKFVNVAAPPASITLEVPKLAREGALPEVEAIGVLRRADDYVVGGAKRKFIKSIGGDRQGFSQSS